MKTTWNNWNLKMNMKNMNFKACQKSTKLSCRGEHKSITVSLSFRIRVSWVFLWVACFFGEQRVNVDLVPFKIGTISCTTLLPMWHHVMENVTENTLVPTEKNFAHLLLQLFDRCKLMTAELLFELGEEAKVTWSHVRRVGRMGQKVEIPFPDRFHGLKGSVGTGIVMMHNETFGLPKLRSLLPQRLLQFPECLNISLWVDGLFWLQPVHENDTFWVTEESQHWLFVPRDPQCLLWALSIFGQPHWRLLFCFLFARVEPSFISCDDWLDKNFRIWSSRKSLNVGFTSLFADLFLGLSQFCWDEFWGTPLQLEFFLDNAHDHTHGKACFCGDVPQTQLALLLKKVGNSLDVGGHGLRMWWTSSFLVCCLSFPTWKSLVPVSNLSLAQCLLSPHTFQSSPAFDRWKTTLDKEFECHSLLCAILDVGHIGHKKKEWKNKGKHYQNWYQTCLTVRWLKTTKRRATTAIGDLQGSKDRGQTHARGTDTAWKGRPLSKEGNVEKWSFHKKPFRRYRTGSVK